MSEIPKNTSQESGTKRENLFRAGKYFSKFLSEVTDLREGVDKLATIKEIKDKKSMSGANAWMLICSIVIASVGLDRNSPAVIIGAMLISPLMSPILGIGLAVGINDKQTLKKSLFHLLTAVVIALVSSTIYFFVSPFSEITPEIQARLEPNPFDIVIAIFGGVAGIVSISRKDISTTLPGVAIATALMPPLCVTGFGIAHGNFQITTHSFYLFFLNTFFVALATYLIVRYLRFPYKDFVDPKDRRKNLRYFAVVILIIIIPSFLIFLKVQKEFQTKQRIGTFIENYLGNDNIYLDEHLFIKGDSVNRLLLRVYGDSINDSKMSYYLEGLRKEGLDDVELEIIPTSEVKLDRMEALEKQLSGMEKIASQLTVAREDKEAQQEVISQMRSQMANLKMDSVSFNRVCNEIKVLFPDVEQVIYANGQATDYNSYREQIPIVSVKWIRKKRGVDEDEKKIEAFMKQRLELDTIVFLKY